MKLSVLREVNSRRRTVLELGNMIVGKKYRNRRRILKDRREVRRWV
jgi:hypothetical protein